MAQGIRRRWVARMVGAVAVAVALCASGVGAQQTGQPGQQGQQRPGGGGGGFGGQRTLPYAANDTTGFTRIFDGTSLAGWDGDPKFWRAEGGMIVGQSTAENPVQQNTFLIYRGDPRMRDFELKLEFRLLGGGNSGVQVRSKPIPGDHPWRLAGYQVDLDFTNRYSGQIYEEQGRGFLAERGQATHVAAGRLPQVIAALGTPLELKGLMETNGWNTMHVIARGNQLMTIFNGRLTSMIIDDDVQGRALEGLLGLQMHTGPPMRVEYRNLFLKR